MISSADDVALMNLSAKLHRRACTYISQHKSEMLEYVLNQAKIASDHGLFTISLTNLAAGLTPAECIYLRSEGFTVNDGYSGSGCYYITLSW